MNKVFSALLWRSVSTLILIAIIGSLLLWLAARSLSYLANQVSQKQTLVAVSQQKATTAEKLKKDYEELKGKIPLVQVALPTEKELFEVLNGIEAKAQKQGLAIDLKIEDSKQGAASDEINLEIKLKGDFTQIDGFLRELFASPFYLSFQSFEILNSQSLLNKDTTVNIKSSLKLWIQR